MTNSNKPLSLQYFLPAIIIFLINPTAAMIFTGISIGNASVDEDGKHKYYAFFLMLSFWLGIINISKGPSGDQGGYLGMFNYIPIGGLTFSINNTINGGGSEWMYGVYNFIMYYVCFGNVALFFFWTTVFIYMLHFVAAFKFFEFQGGTKAEVLCGVLSLAFFSQYFNLTNHLVRQMLATAILIYGFVQHIIGNKKWYVWVIASVFFHTSTSLIAIMTFIPQLYRKMRMKQLIIFACALSALIAMAIFASSTLASITGGHDIVNHGLSKFNENSEESVGLTFFLMSIVIVPLMAGIVSSYIRESNCFSPIYPMCYICMFLIAFVLGTTHNKLMQYRYFYYIYSFIPFMLPLVFDRRNSISKVFCGVISVFFILRFLLSYSNQPWDYAPLWQIIIYPSPHFIFYSPLLDVI